MKYTKLKILEKIKSLLYDISFACEALAEKTNDKILEIKYRKNPPKKSSMREFYNESLEEMFPCKRVNGSKVVYRKYNKLPVVDKPFSEDWDSILFQEAIEEEGAEE